MRQCCSSLTMRNCEPRRSGRWRGGTEVTRRRTAATRCWPASRRGSFDVARHRARLPEGSGSAIAARLGGTARPARRPDVRRGVGRRGEGIAVVRPFTADDLFDAVQARRRHHPVEQQQQIAPPIDISQPAVSSGP
jgi:hypothetical protein